MALTLTCPVCGKRNGYEFRYGGEDKGPRPAEEGLTPAGVQKEWWFHRDRCGAWFTTWRDTTLNLEVVAPEASK